MDIRAMNAKTGLTTGKETSMGVRAVKAKNG
jgi:hypothetical protein